MHTPSLFGSIDRLAHLLSALRGIARALDPDPVMSEHDRVNLYFLTMLLAEQLESCLFDITHVHKRHVAVSQKPKEMPMDNADLSPLPKAVHAAVLLLLEAIKQTMPQAPRVLSQGEPPRYPRSPIELAVLDALAAMHPHGASALDLSHVVPYPRPAISHVLQGLVMLGTIHRLGHGYYVFGPPVSEEERWRQLGLPPRPHAHGHVRLPGPELPPSARYAAQIARIVAQETSRETTASPALGEQGESA
jgi:hypothetical protein